MTSSGIADQILPVSGTISQTTDLTIDEIINLTFAHLKADGLDDIFKPPLLNEPIEQRLLDNADFFGALRLSATKYLEKLKLNGFNTPLYLNVPKSRYTHRRASLLDVEDLVRYTAIVFSLADCIESARIPKENNVVFSNRFTRDTPCFDRNYGHSEFRRRSDYLTRCGKFGVKTYTDISNFFDRINLHRLESTLMDIGCHSRRVKALNEVLHHWSGRNSYGIPVGCDASRVLAEAMLINVDQKLLSEGVVFVRYVDDYRIFTEDYAQAHAHLALLTNSLEEEGLFINGSKTRIASVEVDKQEADGDDPNRGQSRQGFDAIDDKKEVELTRLIGTGYKTRIAKYYKKPGEEAIKRLQSNDLSNLENKCLVDDPSEEDLKEFIKTVIYRDNRDVEALFRVIDRHVHMISYLSDALVKEAQRLEPSERSAISRELISRYANLQGSEYYRLCIARVMSSHGYAESGLFKRWFKELPLDTNPAYLKELIGFFGPSLTRNDIRELASSALNYHPAVTRMIVSYALDSNSTYGERRAWAKKWMNSSNDKLVHVLCRPFMKPEPKNEPDAPDKE